MYLLPIYLSFISFIIAFFFGKKLGNYYTSIFTSVNLFFCFIVTIFIFYEVCILKSTCYIKLIDWLFFDLFIIEWGFLFDPLTVLMLLIVTSVSFCTHVFSIEYMSHDPFQSKFMSYLTLFTFFMLILVTADNMIQLFVGWEGVGICSYLLVNFWFTRLEANKSAMMAVFYNKIGDISLLFAMGIVFYLFKTFDVTIIYSCFLVKFYAIDYNILNLNGFYLDSESNIFINYMLNPFEYLYTFFNKESFFFDYNYLLSFFSNYNSLNMHFFDYLGYLLVVGAVGKSAQVGLHIWLPEAMEGPTPVSSLIHAATMVTAGIFLIVRFSILFELIPNVLLWIIFLGAFTSFLGSSIGSFQEDQKKTIAYSTCSQLGYMFMCCGFSGYAYTMFHLFNHAFFKALLFLSAGYLIHLCMDDQDISSGEEDDVLDLLSLIVLIGNLSLVTFPGFSGCFSKERIIDSIHTTFFTELLNINIYNLFIFLDTLIIGALCLSNIYGTMSLIDADEEEDYYLSDSIIYIKILNNKRKTYKWYILDNQPDSFSIFFSFPLILLCIASIISGFYFQDMLVGMASDFWDSSIYLPMSNTNIIYLKQLNAITYFDTFVIEQLLLKSSWTLFMYEFEVFISIVSSVESMVWILFFFIFVELVDDFMHFSSSKIIFLEDLYYMLFEKYIIFNRFFIEPLSFFAMNKFALMTYAMVDKGLLELIGPYGIVSNLQFYITKYKILYTFYISQYIGFIILCFVYFIHYLFIW